MFVLGVDPDLLRSIGLFPGQVCDHSFRVSFDQELINSTVDKSNFTVMIVMDFVFLAIRELQ